MIGCVCVPAAMRCGHRHMHRLHVPRHRLPHIEPPAIPLTEFPFTAQSPALSPAPFTITYTYIHTQASACVTSVHNCFRFHREFSQCEPATAAVHVVTVNSLTEYPKSDETCAKMLAALKRSTFLFSSLSDGDLQRVVDRMEPLVVPAGVSITMQGETATDFFLLQSGDAHVFVDDVKVCVCVSDSVCSCRCVRAFAGVFSAVRC